LPTPPAILAAFFVHAEGALGCAEGSAGFPACFSGNQKWSMLTV
jgi:hypothetical protein